MTNTNSDNKNSHFPQSVFCTSRKEFTNLELQVTEGELPKDLSGHVFLVAPVGLVTDRPNDKGWIDLSDDGTPLFNGDGMVYRFDFNQVNEGKVKLSSKIAKTPCFDTEEAAINDMEIKDYVNLGLARLSLDLGFRNQVNTAVTCMKFSEEEGYRLMMTWDAGRPYEIDPKSLDVITPVGSNEEWSEQIDLLQIFEVVNTASHPAFDALTRQLFTVSFKKSFTTWSEPLKNLPKEDEDIRQVVFQSCKDFIESLDDVLLEILNNQEQLVEKEINELRQKIRELPQKIRELPQKTRELRQKIRELRQKIKKVGLKVKKQSKGTIQKMKSPFEATLETIDWAMEMLLEVLLKMKDSVRLICWDGKNSLQTWEVVLDDKTPITIPESMHQIAATRDYIVLVNTVFKVGPEQLLPDLLPAKVQLKSPFEELINQALNELNQILRGLFSYQESANTDLYIIRRADLNHEEQQIIAKQVSISMPFAHFLADYENPNDQITLHVAHNTGWDPSSWIRPCDHLATGNPDSRKELPVGMTSGSTDINYLGSYIIDLQDWENPHYSKDRVSLKGKLLSDKELTWMTAIATYNVADGVTLPRTLKNIYWLSWGCWSDLLTEYIVELYKTYPHRTDGIPVDGKDGLLEIAKKGVPVNICRVDVEKGEIVDSYRFEQNVFANSPQFIPRQRREKAVDESMDGYIVLVVNIGENPDTPSEFHIFDAADLRRGPLCKLTNEKLKLGMTLHSAWCPEINERKARYKLLPLEDYKGILDKLRDQHSKNLLKNEKIIPFFENIISSKS
ncbi:MAG: carotenoid oxygenase family protein [Prochloraceae cyanobacterium]|nr:carotenoid oxygenase family protein [Prochloraceae cyanobacterium]